MNGEYFLVVCLNPTLQNTIVVDRLMEDTENYSGEHYLDVSGKGANPSRVLVQLGEQVVYLTHAGGQNRELLFSLLEKDRIKYSWVESNSEIRYCHTFLNQEKHTTTEIIEETQPVSEGTEKKILAKFQELLPGCHTLILAGTKALGYSSKIFPAMVSAAKKLRKKVILDCKGDDLKNSLIFNPDIVKPNLSEFIATFFKGFSLNEHEEQAEALILVKEKMLEVFEQSSTIPVLTRGKYGVLYVNQGKIVSVPAKTIVPVNTIGCGDAFTAGFASIWSREPDIEKAVKKGMACAEKNAQLIHPGVIE